MRLSLLLLAIAVSCRSQDWCRNGLFADDQAALRPARITGTAPAPLYQDSTPGCPQKGPACKESEISPSPANVLLSKTRGAFACIWQSHDAVGWLPASRLDTSVPFDPNPPLSAWAGDWKFFDNQLHLSLTADGRRLHVSGSAFWHGINTTHDGAIEGEAAPSANHLAFAVPPGGCQVRLTLVGRLLAVADTRNCGGANVTFAGVYEPALPPFQAQAASTLKYGRTSDGQDTVDITNVVFELAQMPGEHRLILRKTHSEQNVIGDEGNEPTITVEAWPLGVNPREKPLYRVALDGQDAAVVDDALLVFDRTREIPWWSIYRLDTGAHFFDTYAPLLRFSLTSPEQTERYAGLDIANDESTDPRLKPPTAVGILTYASGDRVIRQALISSDTPDRAAVLHSLADTTFELAYTARTVRVTLTPFRSPATVIAIPILNDDLDLAHARVPPGVHLASAGAR